jgi:hypothetical protein
LLADAIECAEDETGDWRVPLFSYPVNFGVTTTGGGTLVTVIVAAPRTSSSGMTLTGVPPNDDRNATSNRRPNRDEISSSFLTVEQLVAPVTTGTNG